MRWVIRLLSFASIVLPSALLAQTGRITGTVSDSAGNLPITGATVTVVGATPARGAITGTDGRYTIAGVTAGAHSVRVSRIGFAPRTQPVTVVADQSVDASFSLAPVVVQLSTVVSVGYGTQSKRDVTGSVATVQLEANKETPIATVDQLLQGTSPGVQVSTASSEPGGALSVRIRGTSSITGNSEPLYVIDGFPIENDIDASSAGNGGRSRTTSPNPLVTLNPSDIESVTILKDAASTAIYGARGANGVVIITTRQGRGTKPTFTADYYSGAQTVAKTYDLLDAKGYMDYANTFGQNSSTPYTPFPDSVRAAILASGVNTNWQDEIFRTGTVHNLQLSTRGAAGSSNTTRYAISGGVFDNDGIVVGSGLRRYSTRVNLNQTIGSRFELNGQLSAAQARSKSTPTAGQQNANAGAVSAALQYVPILPVLRPDGTYSYINTDLNFYNPLLDAPQTPNPVSLTNEVRDSLSDTRLLGNFYGQAELFKGLKAKVSIGGDYANRGRQTYYPTTTLRGQQSGGAALRANNVTTSWLNENTLTYDHAWAKQNLTVLAGFTRQRTDVDGENINNAGFTTDITGSNDIGAGAQLGGPTVGSRRSIQTLESYLGRVNYSLLDRYLATVTYRNDGSSRFASGRKRGSFPSAAIAWRASSESFLRDVKALNDLKFRLSYGVVGNPSIRPYQSLARLNDQPYSFGGATANGYYETSVANPLLSWESTREINGGVDLGVWNRVDITADVYKKRTRDLLLNIDLPFESGFSSAIANRGTVDNAGFELGVDLKIFKAKRKGDFDWHSSLNYATNKNKVVDLGGPQFIEADLITTDYNLPGTRIAVGQPVGVFYGFKTRGIIRDSASAAAVPYKNFNGSSFKAGDVLTTDVNGDGIIDLSDRTIIGDPTPKFTAGLSNTFGFKGFELTGLLQGSYGNKILNVNRIRTESSPRVNVTSERFYDAWTPTNIFAKYPKIGENPNQVGTNNFTDALLEDGSYLRLRTITLSYLLPKPLQTAGRFSSARVYVTGTNLWTATHYTGFDPDVSSQSTGNTNRGIDIGAYPLTKSVTGGLTFEF